MTRDDQKIDENVDQILAKGHLSGPQYDQILQKVLERSAAPRPEKKTWPLWALLPGGALATGLGALLMLSRPVDKANQFSPKGHPLPALAVGIGCVSTGGPRCRPGDTLMFTINGAVPAGYLGAYAQPWSGVGGQRIWYFPTDTGAFPDFPPGVETHVLSQGVRIGPEHPPGKYRVTIWISSRPLNREDVDGARGADLLYKSTADLEIVP